MKKVFLYIWRIIRYFKPARTFWLTLAALLPVMSTGIESGSVGIESIDWLTAISGAASAAVFNIIVLLGGNDSLWSEPKENTEVVNAKPLSNKANVELTDITTLDEKNEELG